MKSSSNIELQVKIGLYETMSLAFIPSVNS